LRSAPARKRCSLAFCLTPPEGGANLKMADRFSKDRCWHSWAIALVKNPEKSHGRHLFIFDIDASPNTLPPNTAPIKPLRNQHVDVLRFFRPRDWLQEPMHTIYKEIQGSKFRIDTVWLGDDSPKFADACTKTTGRFILRMMRRGDKAFDWTDPVLNGFRKFGE
jgi:hypothetical protein